MKTMMLLALLTLAACEKKADPVSETDRSLQEMRASLERSDKKLKDWGKVLDAKEKLNKVEMRIIKMKELDLDVAQLRLDQEASGGTEEERQALRARLEEIKARLERLNAEGE